jgi:hypothetical protein
VRVRWPCDKPNQLSDVHLRPPRSTDYQGLGQRIHNERTKDWSRSGTGPLALAYRGPWNKRDNIPGTSVAPFDAWSGWRPKQNALGGTAFLVSAQNQRSTKLGMSSGPAGDLGHRLSPPWS